METNSYIVKVDRETLDEDDIPEMNVTITEGEVMDGEKLRSIVHKALMYMEPFEEIKQLSIEVEEKIW